MLRQRSTLGRASTPGDILANCGIAHLDRLRSASAFLPAASLIASLVQFRLFKMIFPLSLSLSVCVFSYRKFRIFSFFSRLMISRFKDRFLECHRGKWSCCNIINAMLWKYVSLHKRFIPLNVRCKLRERLTHPLSVYPSDRKPPYVESYPLTTSCNSVHAYTMRDARKKKEERGGGRRKEKIEKEIATLVTRLARSHKVIAWGRGGSNHPSGDK